MGRKADLKRVDRAWQEAGQEFGTRLSIRFRDYMHKCKETGGGGTGPGGDFTMEELRDLIQEFLDHEGKNR